MSLATYALARSIQPAADFFAVASEVRDKGVEIEQRDGYSQVIGLRDDYQPSEAWTRAMLKFYFSIASAIQDAIDDPDFDAEPVAEVDKWKEVYQEDLIANFGWIHRIILIINFARRVNDAPTDMGDPEFDLMKRVIQQKMNMIEEA